MTDGHAAYPAVEIELFQMVKEFMEDDQGKKVCVLCFHIKRNNEAAPANFVKMCDELKGNSYSFR